MLRDSASSFLLNGVNDLIRSFGCAPQSGEHIDPLVFCAVAERLANLLLEAAANLVVCETRSEDYRHYSGQNKKAEDASTDPVFE